MFSLLYNWMWYERTKPNKKIPGLEDFAQLSSEIVKHVLRGLHKTT
jgi:hypothetical protein